MSLYDLQGAELGALSCPDTSAKYSIQATPGETIVAAGTEQGGVAVWDWQTQQLVEHYKDQHSVSGQGWVGRREWLGGWAGVVGQEGE